MTNEEESALPSLRVSSFKCRVSGFGRVRVRRRDADRGRGADDVG